MTPDLDRVVFARRRRAFSRTHPSEYVPIPDTSRRFPRRDYAALSQRPDLPHFAGGAAWPVPLASAIIGRLRPAYVVWPEPRRFCGHVVARRAVVAAAIGLLEERASQPEILTHYDDIRHGRFLGSGRVTFFGGSEYHAEGASHLVTSRLSGIADGQSVSPRPSGVRGELELGGAYRAFTGVMG